MFTHHLLLPILPPMVVLQAHHLLLWFPWWMIGPHPSQCPITQAQCEQLLSFMKSQSITDRTNSAYQTSSAYESAMVNFGAQFQSGGATSHFINNFTGNPISPSTPSSIDSKHSIFSASIADKQAFASNDWILDTGNCSYSPFDSSSYHHYFCHQYCCSFTYFGNSIINSHRHS